MIQTCKRCGLDTRIPNISFNEKGECNFCSLYDIWSAQYDTHKPELLLNVMNKIKKDGESSKYDCVVGVSGGCDSSYLLYLAKEWGLRPLAVHWDNGWNTDIAKSNLKKVTDGLNVDLKILTPDFDEMNDINKSFLYASVTDVDIPNDIALETVLHKFSEQHNIKYILNGHSFRTEGMAPLGWTYMDGKYIQSVQKQFGKYPIKTFPNLWLSKWLSWCVINRIRHIRPLWYVNYIKADAKQILNKQFGWEWYGGHHKENKYTLFAMYHIYNKFGIDKRLISNAALVRDGQQTLEESFEVTCKPITIPKEILNEVYNKLYIDEEEYKKILTLKNKTYHDYETYSETYKRLKYLFWVLAKLDLVPMTFYTKYTNGKTKR